MAAFVHFLKTIFTPLLFAAILYLLFAHILIPLYRRHRTRYAQYLPLSTPNLSGPSSSSLPSRIFSALTTLIPSSWLQQRLHHVEGHDEVDDSAMFSDEEGEGMVGFEPLDERRRDAMFQEGRIMGGAEERRLSRELEEGFRDESDEEDAPRRMSIGRR